MTNIAIPTLTLLAIVIAMLLAMFLLALKTKRTLSNRLFAAFLILCAIDISGIIDLPHTGFFQKLEVFKSMLILVHLPVFYWYVKSVCYSDFELKRHDFLHFLPFLAVNFVLITIIYFPSFARHTTTRFFPTVLVIFHLQVFIYLWLSFQALRKFKNLYINNFAGDQLEAYQWLKRLTIALAIFFSIALLKNIFRFTPFPELSEPFRLALLLFELMVLCWYLFQAISKPEVFRGIHSKLSLDNYSESTIEKSKIKDLMDVMDSEKLYLNPSITVKDVADKLDMPVRDLSTLLNKHLEKHFFDFINEYRVKEAQEIFRKSEDNKLTVLEVLYEVGFNSKSSFNTAFKKHTGSTPTDYRNSL